MSDQSAYDDQRYINNLPIDPAALAAMVAATGVDHGLRTAQKVLGIIGVTAGAAGVLVPKTAVNGWMLVNFIVAGICVGLFWVKHCRRQQTAISKRLIDRFGPARFMAAKPIVDQAKAFILER